MTMKNKYVIRSRISEHKFREIIKYFSLDLNAVQIQKLTGLSRQSINKYLIAIRIRIAHLSQLQPPLQGEEVEVDESYFGAKRVKGKKGRGAKGKIIVFGLLKRGGKVYTEIIPNCTASTLTKIIRGQTSIDTVIHSDGWRGYNGLVDWGNSHINGIESFWGFAKTRLVKFKGMDKSKFELHLKECEFRFNNRGQNLYKTLLNTVVK